MDGKVFICGSDAPSSPKDGRRHAKSDKVLALILRGSLSPSVDCSTLLWESAIEPEKAWRALTAYTRISISDSAVVLNAKRELVITETSSVGAYKGGRP